MRVYLPFGLTYETLSLEWSIYRSPFWEEQWDKASFRAIFLKNKNYEDLQVTLQNTRTSIYAFLVTSITLVISVVYV